MPYTIWSRGRMLGETELDYVRCMRKHRAGDFHPTSFGHTVMPLATEPTVAVVELAKVIRAFPIEEADGPTRRRIRSADPAWATAQADLAAAYDRREGLALELRGPTGVVIPTEWIDIRDTKYLIELADEQMAEDDLFDEPLSPELMADIEHDLAVIEEDRRMNGFDAPEPWRPDDEDDFPRYQIQVRLLDDSAVP